MVEPKNQENRMYDTLSSNSILIDNEQLSSLVKNIREGGLAKNNFREIFEVYIMLFIEKEAQKRVRDKNVNIGSKPVFFFYDNAQQIASTITEILIKHIEKGSYDTHDLDGNPIFRRDGTPMEYHNLAGALIKKVNYLFKDFLRGSITPYLNYFSENNPHEKKYLETLEKLKNIEENPLEDKKISAKKKALKKKLKEFEIINQFIGSFKDDVFDASLSEIDKYLLKEKEKDFYNKIIICFKKLSEVQKKYLALKALGFLQATIANIYDVSETNVYNALSIARGKMSKCVSEMNDG